MTSAGRVRGRPVVFSDDALQRATGYSYARTVSTRRGAQDLVYRMFAIATLEHYCEAFPENAPTLGWYFRPKRRHTLLTELGRIARPRTDASGALIWDPVGVERLVTAALELAEERPTTKDGVARLRAKRA